MNKVFFNNNIDLIRLMAAFQVLISHSVNYLSINTTNSTLSLLMYVLHLFPGVPIFFFISGYLISKSYENSSSIKNYATKRLFRIYSALIIAVILGVFSIYVTGYISSHSISITDISIWIFTKLTIFQFYNPECNREYGIGIVNPALWTISIELQFYIITPIIYKLFLQKNNEKILFVFITFSMLINYISSFYLGEYHDFLPFKLLGVSFIPWIYMFLFGVLFQRNFVFIYDKIDKNFFGKKRFLLIIFIIYIGIDFIFTPKIGNYINPLIFLLLILIIFTFSYSFIGLSGFIKYDLSYGIYVYHMIIVNLFIYYGLVSNILYELCIIVCVLVMAYISWKYIEKPSITFNKE